MYNVLFIYLSFSDLGAVSLFRSVSSSDSFKSLYYKAKRLYSVYDCFILIAIFFIILYSNLKNDSTTESLEITTFLIVGLSIAFQLASNFFLIRLFNGRRMHIFRVHTQVFKQY